MCFLKSVKDAYFDSIITGEIKYFKRKYKKYVG